MRKFCLCLPFVLGPCLLGAAQVHAQEASGHDASALKANAPTANAPTASAPKASTPKRETPKPVHHPDRTMQPRVGKASIYADRFGNRKMANGKPMDLNGDNAASKTLPLGTKALVTNLQTGKSAVVTIEDRGPYVQGRIVDLSPATAEKIGLAKRQGIAPVEVRPLELPPLEGTVASAEADVEDDSR